MRSRLFEFLRRPAVAATMAALILRGLTLISRFLLSLLLARMLSPAEMGEYGLVTAALAFALLAVGLEFYSYTLRELVPAAPDRRARIIANQIVLAVIALLVVAMALFGAVAANLFPGRLTPWFLVILVTEHVSLEATRILIVTWRPVRAYIVVFLRGGLWVYVTAALMFAAPSMRTLETVLVSWALGGLFSIAVAALSLADLPWSGLRRFRPDAQAIKGGLLVARPFMLTAAGALVISYLDRFVIDAIVGRTGVGIYTFYSTILIGLLSLGSSVSHQFLPKVIAAYAEGSDPFRATLKSLCWSMLALALGTGLLSALLMRPMLAALGLSTYLANILLFYVMLPGVVLRMFADVPSYALYAARSDTDLLVCNIGSAIVSTLLNILLIPRFGLYGAAFASGVASAALFLSLLGFAVYRFRAPIKEPAFEVPPTLPNDSDLLYP